MPEYAPFVPLVQAAEDLVDLQCLNLHLLCPLCKQT